MAIGRICPAPNDCKACRGGASVAHWTRGHVGRQNGPSRHYHGPGRKFGRFRSEADIQHLRCRIAIMSTRPSHAVASASPRRLTGRTVMPNGSSIRLLTVALTAVLLTRIGGAHAFDET